MLDQEARRIIDAEIRRAAQAMEEGNEGMVRVCCRRAAGEALRALASVNRGHEYGMHAMARLEGLSRDPSAPDPVRAAALRLRSKRNEQGERDGSAEPLADFDIILAYVQDLIDAPPSGSSSAE